MTKKERYPDHADALAAIRGYLLGIEENGFDDASADAITALTVEIQTTSDDARRDAKARDALRASLRAKARALHAVADSLETTEGHDVVITLGAVASGLGTLIDKLEK